jgi:soluble lytic murein transglycosylase-like protein
MTCTTPHVAWMLTIPCPMMAFHGIGTPRSIARVCCLVMAALMVIAITPTMTERDFETRPHSSKQEISRAIHFYAKRYRLDPRLLRAVIKVESGFKQDAVSRKGAVGLMQLTPATAKALHVVDVHDPVQNIRGGAKQLRHLLNRYDDNLPLALAAYNAGVNRIKGRKVPRIRETRAYVKKVLRHYHRSQTKSRNSRSHQSVRSPRM